MAPARGTTLVLLGVGLFVLTMAVGAVTAPDRNVAGAPTEVPATDTPAPTSTAGADTATTSTEPSTETPTATPAGPRTLVGMQGGWVSDGSIFLLSGNDEQWRETAADGYFEVSMLDDGTVLAAFANETSTDCGELDSPCARTGFRHIDPSGPDGPEIVAEYSFPVETLTNSEVHAVDKVGEDSYVFTDMDQERVVLVENGTEVWEWRAEAHYDAPADPTSRDWLHINDVDAIGDDRFLVSVRNANQLVILERGEGVVETINEDRGTSDENCLKGGRLDDFDGEDDGDVRCGDPSVIKEQHNPQWLGPGAVLVADSENDRVVELHRTEDGAWEPAWVVRQANDIELKWPRDADRLPNGNTLITDTWNKRVVEIDPNGTAVWSTSTEGFPYEADRLPYGEYAGQYDSGTPTPNTDSDSDETATPDERTPLPTAVGPGDGDETGGEIPGLTLAVGGLKGTFLWIPWWFSEGHLATAILSIGLVIGGVADFGWRRYQGE